MKTCVFFFLYNREVTVQFIHEDLKLWFIKKDKVQPGNSHTWLLYVHLITIENVNKEIWSVSFFLTIKIQEHWCHKTHCKKGGNPSYIPSFGASEEQTGRIIKGSALKTSLS